MSIFALFTRRWGSSHKGAGSVDKVAAITATGLDQGLPLCSAKQTPAACIVAGASSYQLFFSLLGLL